MARFILEDCDISADTKFRNLITIGTPNQGVSKIPGNVCRQSFAKNKKKKDFCTMQTSMFDSLAYTESF